MNGATTFAIVPVKALAQAKRRLAAVLPDAPRQRLVLTMLQDVLAAASQVDDIASIVVVTPDASAARLAECHGAVIVPEPSACQLNAAVEGGIAFAISRGAGQVLVLPADIPLATPDELKALIGSRGSKPGVTLAPSHDGDGTNALLLAPPSAISPCYGPGSYLQHLSQAMARQIDVNVLHLPAIARDIDQPVDLAQLSAVGGERYAFLGPYLKNAERGSDHTAAVEEQ